MNDLVTCRLAHPLEAKTAREFGLPARRHEVGEEITLSRSYAMRLVNSGWILGAEPKRPETVRAALRPARTRPQTPAPAAPAPTPAARGKTSGGAEK